MSKTIKFSYKNQDYTLEFTKKTVRQLASQGVTPELITQNPLQGIPNLFAGAFKKHHPKASRPLIDEIYENIGGKESLLVSLVELYNAPIAALMDEPDEDAKIEWEQV